MNYLNKHASCLLWGLGLLLIAGAIVMENLAIYYSSVPHFEQMGWALFCGFNGLFVAVLGAISIVVAESHGVAMRQLDYERAQKEAV